MARQDTKTDGTCTFSEDGTRLIAAATTDRCYRVPDGVVELAPHSFRFCSALEHVILPDSLERIGDGAFFGCRKLSRADLPSSLIEIGAEAFFCTALEQVTIPASLESIGEVAFSFVKKGRDWRTTRAPSCAVQVDPGNDRYFIDNDFLCERAGESTGALLYFGNGEEVAVPRGVTHIASYAVMEPYAPNRIVLPETLLDIGNHGLSTPAPRLGVIVEHETMRPIELYPVDRPFGSKPYSSSVMGGSFDLGSFVRDCDDSLQHAAAGVERARRMAARLLNGVELSQARRLSFLGALKSDLLDVVEACARIDDGEMIHRLCHLGIINERNISSALDVASAAGGIAVCKQLMDESKFMNRLHDLEL